MKSMKSFAGYPVRYDKQQAGTELGQAQLKLGLDSTLISFRYCFPRIGLVDFVLYV